MKRSHVHNVFLGVPVGGDGSLSVATHKAIAATQASKHKVMCSHTGSSALTFNFNSLLAEALNRRDAGEPHDVFAMIHTDIAPQSEDWLDRLLEIYDRTQADLLAAIVPIKDAHGLTSTGLDTSRWTPRRFTMHEVFTLPPTFDGEFVREKFGAPLLLNTGLLLMRLTAPWIEEACFNIDNCIARGPDGQRVAFFEPEDWKISRWANERGLKLVATREVAVGHLGGAMYANTSAWGSLPVDTINLAHSAMGQSGMIPK